MRYSLYLAVDEQLGETEKNRLMLRLTDALKEVVGADRVESGVFQIETPSDPSSDVQIPEGE